MKKLILCCVLALTSSAFAFALKPVHVRATTTRTGVTRQAHMRTSPNHTKADNYSTKGNTNPYTGKPGTKKP